MTWCYHRAVGAMSRQGRFSVALIFCMLSYAVAGFQYSPHHTSSLSQFHPSSTKDSLSALRGTRELLGLPWCRNACRRATRRIRCKGRVCGRKGCRIKLLSCGGVRAKSAPLPDPRDPSNDSVCDIDEEPLVEVPKAFKDELNSTELEAAGLQLPSRKLTSASSLLLRREKQRCKRNCRNECRSECFVTKKRGRAKVKCMRNCRASCKDYCNSFSMIDDGEDKEEVKVKEEDGDATGDGPLDVTDDTDLDNGDEGNEGDEGDEGEDFLCGNDYYYSGAFEDLGEYDETVANELDVYLN